MLVKPLRTGELVTLAQPVVEKNSVLFGSDWFFLVIFGSEIWQEEPD
jgi:hypothetical protein